MITRALRVGLVAGGAIATAALLYACALADNTPSTPVEDGKIQEVPRELTQATGGFESRFSTDDGMTLVRTTSRSEISLHTTAVGRTSTLRPLLDKGVLHSTKTRATIDRATLHEWFEHRASGIEHTIVVDARPPVANSEPLVVEIETKGATPTLGKRPTDLILKNPRDPFSSTFYGGLAVTDANGKALSARFVIANGNKAQIHVEDDDALYPVTIDPMIWALQSKLVEISGQPRDALGASVSIEGDRILAGYSGRNTNRGGIAVYERSDASWTETFAYAPEVDAAPPNTYRGLNSALSGDTLLVGSYAPGYIFEHDDAGTGWHPTAFLDVPWNKLGGPNTTPVALAGNTAVLSLPQWLPNFGDAAVNPPGTTAGALFFFEREGGTWVGPNRMPYPTSPPPASFTFGNIVLQDNVLVLNASNRIHVFRRSSPNDAFTLEASISPPLPAANFFLQAVALDGDRILAGTLNTNNSVQGGSFYQREGSAWTLVQSVVEPPPRGQLAGSRFGYAVAIKGDVAFIGDYEGTGVGSVFRYQRNGPANAPWTYVEELTPTDANGLSAFGYSIAATADSVVVGAIKQAAVEGALYLYAYRGGLGDTCTHGNQCASDYCIDGVCCESTCGDGDPTDCLACNATDHRGKCGPADPTFECRPARGECDVGERCNGTSTVCPANLLKENGSVCGGNGGRCFAGACSTEVEKSALGPGVVVPPPPPPLAKDDSGCALARARASASSFSASVPFLTSVVFLIRRRRRRRHQKNRGVILAAILFPMLMLLPSVSEASMFWRQRDTYAPTDLESADGYGGQIVIKGNTAFVSTSPGYANLGRVDIYERVGKRWVLSDTVRSPTPAKTESFGTGLDASADGKTIAVSAIRQGGAGTTGGPGAVYIFVKGAAGGWTHQQKIVSPTASFFFGWQIALTSDGNTLAVGHVLAQTVYVYTRDPSTNAWSLRATLTGDADTAYFGSSVAFSGNTLAVGAATYAFNINTSLRGHVYLYVGAGDTWTREAKLAPLPSEPIERAVFFGNHIAIDGDVVLASNGISYADPPESGRAYVYERSNGTWTRTQTLVASDAHFGDGFSGNGGPSSGALAIRGNRMIIGASNGKGFAYLFERDASGGLWKETNRFIAVDGKREAGFGGSADFAGDDMVLIAESGANANRGQFYSFFHGSEGGPCENGDICSSDLCIDGVCCDSVCGNGDPNDCMACSVKAGGRVDGICGPSTPHLCRAAKNECDVAESCDGVNIACPADLLESNGKTCAAGVCSVGQCITPLAISSTPTTTPPPSSFDPNADESGCTIVLGERGTRRATLGVLLIVIAALGLRRSRYRRRN